MNKICFGCGAKLQTVNPEGLGFVPENVYETSKYCKRCFRSMNYGENVRALEPKNTKTIVNTVNKNAKYVVFLVDWIDIFDEIMDIFASIKVPKVLIVSKSDIIPKNVSYAQIKNYLRVVYKVKDDILFTSNKTNLNTFIKSLHDKDEVYFLGMTNAGKSTLLNALMDKMGTKQSKLATSYKENTTQDFVRIKVGDKTFIDSPGFVLTNYEVDKKSNISSEIKPVTYQNKTSCTYKIGNDITIRFKESTSVIFYFSKNIDIKRLYKNEVIGVTFKVRGNTDIVVCGLGFIKTTKDVTVVLPEELFKYINIRPSIVGGTYE